MVQNTGSTGPGTRTVNTPVGADWRGPDGTGTSTGPGTGSGMSTGTSSATGTTVGTSAPTSSTAFRSETNVASSSAPIRSSETSTNWAGETATETTGRELIVTERPRSRPSTAAIIGSAVAGAVAGGAIPFMLSGRKSARSTSVVEERHEPHVSGAAGDGRTRRWSRRQRP